MHQIAPKNKWMMVDGLNVVEGPDKRGYIEIFSWHDTEPPEALNLPGMPIEIDESADGAIYAHAGREWLFIRPAPEPVSDRRMPECP